MPDMTRTRPIPLPRSLAVLAMATSLVLVGSAPSAAAAVRVTGAPSCRVFPAGNVWNRRVDSLPVRADSEVLKASIGLGSYLHPDFGSPRVYSPGYGYGGYGSGYGSGYRYGGYNPGWGGGHNRKRWRG